MFKKLSVCIDHVCRRNGQTGFFSSIRYQADIKRNSRSSYDFDISSFAGGFYGESSDFSKYYSESICIGDIGWYFISRDFME